MKRVTITNWSPFSLLAASVLTALGELLLSSYGREPAVRFVIEPSLCSRPLLWCLARRYRRLRRQVQGSSLLPCCPVFRCVPRSGKRQCPSPSPGSPSC